MEILKVLVVSDSTGETGEMAAKAWLSQFEDVEFDLSSRSDTTDQARVDGIFREDLSHAVMVLSVVMPDVALYLQKKCVEAGVPFIDLFDIPLRILEDVTGKPACRLPGLTRELDPEYFNKISCIEFAVKYDDGKDKRGLLKADIVLIGVSRTSKTPLSMLLANKGYNVCNLPLVPEISVPAELYRVDPKRVIGLIISPEKLGDIRTERMKDLGLDGGMYSDEERIARELAYAQGIFEKVGCAVIDVSAWTIEQSATRIIEEMRKNFATSVRRHCAM